MVASYHKLRSWSRIRKYYKLRSRKTNREGQERGKKVGERGGAGEGGEERSVDGGGREREW